MKNIIKIMLMAVIALTLLLSLSCNMGEDSLTYGSATSNVTALAKELLITSFTNGKNATLNQGSAGFDNILNYVQQTVPVFDQPRYTKINGRTAERRIPYKLTYNLEFTLKDGSKIDYDFGGDQLWFPTQDRLYAATVDKAFSGLLDSLVNK